MPIDPRMLAQVQALRGGGGLPPGTGMGPPAPGMGIGQPRVPVNPYAGGPQSGLGLTPAQRVPGMGGLAPVPGAAPTGQPQLTPESAALVGGIPQARERFAQGERAGTLADQLRASSLTPTRGRMVGRVYVPASIAEGGAKLIQAYVARQKEKEQKAERAGAKETESGLLSDWLKSLGDTAGPAPAPGAGGARGA
jgi:hypothetical protein